MSVRTLAVALTLTALAGSAFAQTPPSNGGGTRPFGTRPGSNHGGPFTPGTAPGGPYTPGTSNGGGGAGPFTPGVDGPAGPMSPNNNMPGSDRAGGEGPFSNQQPGFFTRVGRSIWGGLKSFGTWIYTLGGYAPWAGHGATGTVSGAPGGFGNNAGRYDNTIFNNQPPTDPNAGAGTVATDTTGTNAGGGRGMTSSGATTVNTRRPGTTFINP